jgi:AraC-like DNA-binding protein
VEERARQVAQALTDDPADRRTLAEWGRQVGASERTLARGFVAGTGLAFGRWRARLRLQAALPALAAGQPVGNVARHVGYESASAFVAAFRRETGLTPAAYFRSPPAPPAVAVSNRVVGTWRGLQVASEPDGWRLARVRALARAPSPGSARRAQVEMSG